ncbi:MAG: hypothetical protein JWQ72_3981 [Polaromonas sp.]|nr:hypothetical protein [Polaromonas sp.]
MKRLWQGSPLLMAAALLCGCPDSNVPKAPPNTPQPKAMAPAGAAPATAALARAWAGG